VVTKLTIRISRRGNVPASPAYRHLISHRSWPTEFRRAGLDALMSTSFQNYESHRIVMKLFLAATTTVAGGPALFRASTCNHHLTGTRAAVTLTDRVISEMVEFSPSPDRERSRLRKPATTVIDGRGPLSHPWPLSTAMFHTAAVNGMSLRTKPHIPISQGLRASRFLAATLIRFHHTGRPRLQS